MPFQQPTTLKTPAGSMVNIRGAHQGDIQIDFDWFEENACIDCQVDLDASRETNWKRLVWTCEQCSGGSADLREEPGREGAQGAVQAGDQDGLETTQGAPLIDLQEDRAFKRLLSRILAEVIQPEGSKDFSIPGRVEPLLREACQRTGVAWRWVQPDSEALSQDLRALAGELQAKGYKLVQWVEHPRGLRANRRGKLSVPSNYTKERACLIHGNLAKARHETYPGEIGQGIIILDVAPCLVCNPQAVALVRASPRTW